MMASPRSLTSGFLLVWLRWVFNAPCWPWMLNLLNCPEILGDYSCFSASVFPKIFECKEACPLSFNHPKCRSLPRPWCVVSFFPCTCVQAKVSCKLFDISWTVVNVLTLRQKFKVGFEYIFSPPVLTWLTVDSFRWCLVCLLDVSLSKFPLIIQNCLIYVEIITFSSFVARYETAELFKTTCF
jgi:hypothetical protein